MQQTFAASILNKAGRSMSNHVKHAVRLRCYASITQAAIPALSASNAPTASRRVRKRQLNDQEGRVMLKNMPLPELERWCQQQGETPKRALQLWRWMYSDDLWIRYVEDTLAQQGGFSASFIAQLEPVATVDGGLELQQVHSAADGTRKLVFRLTTGEGAGFDVETVLIPVVRSQGRRPRTTLCISSQVGCAMNCQFCFTGRMGLKANLSTAQIVEQVVEAQRFMALEAQAAAAAGKAAPHAPITNVVFMGMGEPMHNADAVLAAVDILCHPLGLHLSHNKVTVSTVGLVPDMEHFMRHCTAQLAVSLHATTDEVRDWIAPVNRRWPLRELVGSLHRHFPCGSTRGPHGRHVLIEYVMLRGVNDSLEDAHRLVQLMQDIECKVNLIMFNPHEGTRFTATGMDQIMAFRSVLIQAGRVCTVRDSRGDDESAACGQLGALDAQQGQAPVLRPPTAALAAALAG